MEVGGSMGLFRWRDGVAMLATVATMAMGVELASAQAAPAPPPLIVHAGELLETPGEAPLSQATLVVVDGKVQAVRQGFVGAEAVGLPANTQVVDLSRMFVMPGFIDLHVHLAGAGH